MSVPMTLSDLERRKTWVNFFRRISLITLVPFDRTTKFGRIKHAGERYIFLGVTDAPTTRAGGKRSPILGVPFYLCIHAVTQNYRISHVTHGEGLVFTWSATSPIQGDGVRALHNFVVPF